MVAALAVAGFRESGAGVLPLVVAGLSIAVVWDASARRRRQNRAAAASAATGREMFAAQVDLAYDDGLWPDTRFWQRFGVGVADVHLECDDAALVIRPIRRAARRGFPVVRIPWANLETLTTERSGHTTLDGHISGGRVDIVRVKSTTGVNCLLMLNTAQSLLARTATHRARTPQ